MSDTEIINAYTAVVENPEGRPLGTKIQIGG
jgi:hypothetical protein